MAIMTKREKKRFVRDLIGTIQQSILEEVNQMPEDWDGVELRRRIADRANEANWSNHHLRGSTLRGKAYLRVVYNNELRKK